MQITECLFEVSLHSPQRYLNPRMQFCPVPTHFDPSKSGQYQRMEAIRVFDFKGLSAKLLN